MPSLFKFGDKEVNPSVGFQTGSRPKQSNVRRWRWVIGFGIFIVIVVAIALLVYFLMKKETGPSLSPEFQELEGDMKSSVDPCNDFYEYSCGKYIDRYLPNRFTYQNVYRDKFATLQEENIKKAKETMESMSKTKDPFFKKAYSYYQSCMTGNRVFNVYVTSAQQIGGSDITTFGNFDLSRWNLENAIKDLITKFNANPLFSVKIRADLFNTSRNIIMIDPPDFKTLSKLASEEEMGYFPGTYSDEVLEEDMDTVSLFVSRFGDRIRQKFIDDITRSTSKSSYNTRLKVREAERFEMKVISDLQSTFSGVKIRQRYKVISLSQLNNLTNYQIKWLGLLQSIYPAHGISLNTKIGLFVPQTYLQKLSTYVSASRSLLPNFFALFLLKKLSPVLPDAYFAAYYFNGNADVIGTKGKERWRACLLDTETSLPMSVGMMFTKATIADKTVNETSTMLKEIQKSFEEGSTNLTWLDKSTKDAVHTKIQNVIDIISGPKVFKDGWLDSTYRQVVSSSGDLGGFFLSSQRNLARMNLEKLKEKPKREEWDLSAGFPILYQVNAFYDRTRNAISILSGILRQPFMYSDGPKYLNYAKIGAILGHELLHGFDSNGWYYDKDGQLAPWWTPSSAHGFSIREACVKNQYDRYVIAGMNIDGNKTLGENIADNAGLKYAFHAYKKWASKNPKEIKPEKLKTLSHEQLFFIGYGQLWCRAASRSTTQAILRSDNHSPNRYRVIGSVSNFPEFGRVFNCPMGSAMNPRNKCEFW